MNELHFGDNLKVLRNHVKDETVDLIYLDPPFNPNVIYGVFFKEGGGGPSEAQVEAFRDIWAWGNAAAEAYEDVMRMGGDTAGLLRSFRSWFGESGMMAYLAMMAVRLFELRRVLKPTGSIYLHCDPTASHYLKVLLDAVFGTGYFRNEVVWKRTSAHSGAKRFGPVHDSILFYTASDEYIWNTLYRPYDESYIKSHFGNLSETGEPFYSGDLTGPGTRKGPSGQPWRGFDPTEKGRHWQPASYLYSKYKDMTGDDLANYDLLVRLDKLDEVGLINWPKKLGGFPRYKQFLADRQGMPLQDIWTDIDAINSQAQERLGYPTQKPIALLERIISASSREGDVVLDPFCGCGTTIEAAEQKHRNWIGIDITHYAVTLIETRLKKAHPEAIYKVYGRPTDLAGARDLAGRDKYQFQWWAAWKLGAQTYESKKGADRGIDANIYFPNGPYGHGRIIVSVKGGENVAPSMVSELGGVVQREGAEMGVLVTLVKPTPAMIANAAGAGFVEKSAHGRLPRLQIVTAEDLIDERFPRLPPLPVPDDSPRSVPRRRRDKDQLELLLPFQGGGGLMTEDGSMIDPRFVRIG